jgi:predicted regulator of Ras-like GTPase activity (Roadblock/LC7/MglB family)
VKRTHAAILVLIFAASLVGLDVLLSRILAAPPGWDPTSDLTVIVLGVATSLALALFGLFLGAALSKPGGADRRHVDRLASALEYERAQHLALSKERYETRKQIVALEERIAELSRKPGIAAAPAAEPAATAIPEAATGADRPGAAAEQAALRGEILALQERYERLRRELAGRREHMVDLMTELSLARTEAEEARAEAEVLRSRLPDAVAPLERLEGKSIREVLESIVALEGVSVALVADDAGLVVDSAGELLQPDTLAALSGIAAEITPRIGDLLPIGEITTVALGDATGKVLEVRYFPLFGAACALAIVREEVQVDPRIARAAIEAIVSRLKD